MDHNGAAGVLRAVQAHRTQQHVGEGTPPSAADHQQISVAADFDQDVRCVAPLRYRLPPHLRRPQRVGSTGSRPAVGPTKKYVTAAAPMDTPSSAMWGISDHTMTWA